MNEDYISREETKAEFKKVFEEKGIKVTNERVLGILSAMPCKCEMMIDISNDELEIAKHNAQTEYYPDDWTFDDRFAEELGRIVVRKIKERLGTR